MLIWRPRSRSISPASFEQFNEAGEMLRKAQHDVRASIVDLFRNNGYFLYKLGSILLFSLGLKSYLNILLIKENIRHLWPPIWIDIYSSATSKRPLQPFYFLFAFFLMATLHSLRFFSATAGLLLAAWQSQPAWAQAAPQPPSFFATYNYLAYTVYDNSSTEPPTEVHGVGGSLTLHPAGTYEKRLSIVGPNGPMYFKQNGTFVLTGDSIRFAFTDLKGADVQRGTFRFVPATQHLTLTIFGYPAGNQGVYELVMAENPPQPAPPMPRAKPSRKRRR